MTFRVCAFKSVFPNTFDQKYYVKHKGNQRDARGTSKERKTKKFHNRKIIAPTTLWANKMTFRVRAFKSLFSDTFEHDEKDDEAPLIWNVRKHFSSIFFLLLYIWGFAHWHFDKPIKLFEHNKTSSWNYHSDIGGFHLHLFPFHFQFLVPLRFNLVNWLCDVFATRMEHGTYFLWDHFGLMNDFTLQKRPGLPEVRNMNMNM